MQILVVEDHPELGRDLQSGLERSGYRVNLASSGEDALAVGLATSYDLVILDILLPGLNGFEVCRRLRDHERRMPILFLTALSEVHHRIEGLDLGADDYLTKPFAFQELQARVRALLRREPVKREPVLRFLDLVLDTYTHEVWRGERQIMLSSKEYALLELFLSYPSQVWSRSRIAERVWEEDAHHLSNIVDVYIRYLRNKLCANGEPDVIQTIRGVGYRLQTTTHGP
jgi:DNA-binding response OmpR family regulator